MHNFSSLLNITPHVSDGLSVHHLESKTVHAASCIWHRGSLTTCQEARDGTREFHLVAACKWSTNLYDIYLMLYVK